MILTIPVLLYQLLFVAITYVTSLVGRKATWAALVLSFGVDRNTLSVSAAACTPSCGNRRQLLCSSADDATSR